MKLLFLITLISMGNSIVSDMKFGKDISIENQIQKLLKKLINSQTRVSTEYEPKIMFPPVTYKMKKGLFSSFIHLNFHGGELESEIRNKMSFPDDNGFVTMNVLEVLLDLWDYNVKVPINVLNNALSGIMDHQDRNSPRFLPKFSFWTQEAIKTRLNTTGYSAHPTNIVVPLKMYKSMSGLVNFAVKTLKLPGNVKQLINVANDFSTIGGVIFSIPPDADDTGCMLGVTSQLLKMIKENDLLRGPASEYFTTISDPNKEALDSYVKYAYRPYSDKVDESVIDPRTYHWMRHFLAERNGYVDLITTWFQKISEIPEQGDFQKMPFSVNNVDGSVVVNGLYGILGTLFTQPVKYASKITSELVKLISDSLDLVQYILENNLIATHAASILLYYPSRFAFYYFISRLCNLMESGPENSKDLPVAFSEVISNYGKTLRHAMQKYGTEQLISLKIDDVSKGMVYWDDFLGNGDLKPKYEDRVFSTSMALNALINTWTVRDYDKGTKKLRYVDEVPPIVVSSAERSAQFLLSNEADFLPQENAFFSASVKNEGSLPFFGVTNYRKSVDGHNSLDCTESLYKGVHYVFGVKGLMSDTDYNLQSKAGCFNMSTGNPDVDYNSPDAVFPYWSAPSYTYAVRLLSFVKYRSLL